ncbi:MAG: Cyclic di-GMP phosphodiesterase response regulator RpfG [bacterium ADurb.Bin243]|nr:MAG: Cyclic di-GMP phosphodiesterase response regulator RpfG [bacterium ADurb.Bin243]
MKETRIGIKVAYIIGLLFAVALLLVIGISVIIKPFSVPFIACVLIIFAMFMGLVSSIIKKSFSLPIYEIIKVIDNTQDNKELELDSIDKSSEMYEIAASISNIIDRINKANQKINQRKIIEMDTVHKISKAMSARLSLDEVLRLIIDLATSVLDAKYASLMLIEEETNELTIRVSNGLTPEIMKKVRIKVGSGIAGTVAYEGKPYLSKDIENDPRFKKSSNPKFETKSFICVPVKLGDKVIGVLNINDKKNHEIFNDDDLHLLTILANQAAITIENSRLYQQAEKKVEELEMLFSASKVMSSILDVNILLRQVLETCIHIVFSKAGMIMLFNPDSMQFEIKTCHGPIDMRCAYEFRIDSDSELCEKLSKELNAMLITNIDENIDLADLTNYLKFRVKEIICVPLHTKQKVTGMMLVISDVSQNNFVSSDLSILSALSTQAAVVIENAKLYESMKDQFLSTIRVATNALEFKDAYTSGHSERVTEFAVLLSKELNLAHEEIENIRQAAILHDIGKIGISETILTKKGRLTDEEFATIKLHPSIGDSIVEPMALNPIVRAGIRNHHERWDGRGYPDGLAGEKIPFSARIIALADAFDAMTSNRPYRDAMAMEKVYSEFIKCAGGQFDPNLAEVFVNMLKKMDAKTLTSQNAGSLTAEPINNIENIPSPASAASSGPASPK